MRQAVEGMRDGRQQACWAGMGTKGGKLVGLFRAGLPSGALIRKLSVLGWQPTAVERQPMATGGESKGNRRQLEGN